MKPTLVIQFEGVLHPSFAVVPTRVFGPPTDGAMAFLATAVQSFNVQIYSLRLFDECGTATLWEWIRTNMIAYLRNALAADIVVRQIDYCKRLPPGVFVLTPCAIPFTGRWPSVDDILNGPEPPRSPRLDAPEMGRSTSWLRRFFHRS